MKGGGSVGQSLQYVDPNAPERSAEAGQNLLVQRGLIARPAIGGGSRKLRKGGFFPSIMTGVVDNALLAAPLAAMAGRKLLNNNTRKRGGSRKGNQWKAQQEEARAILKEIGNPSARNVLLYAAAKRRNSVEAEQFLEAFRNKKVKKAEEFAAKRMAQAQKKEMREAALRARAEAREQKKKEKEAKAATKKKRAPKPAAPKTAKAKKGTHLFFNNEGQVINKPKAKAKAKATEKPMTQAQLKREAEANAAAAKKEMAKPLKESQVAWLSLIDKASKQLKAEGIQSRANAMRLASLMKQGKNVEPFLQNLRSKRLTMKSEKPSTPNKRRTAKKTAVPATEKAAVPEVPKTAAKKTAKKTATAAAGNNGTKKAKPRSAAQQAYSEALRTAAITLGTMGKPKPGNRAKWASLKTSKESNAAAKLAAFESNFRSRQTAPTATAAKGKAKKALTAVAEANESNENNE